MVGDEWMDGIDMGRKVEAEKKMVIICQVEY